MDSPQLLIVHKFSIINSASCQDKQSRHVNNVSGPLFDVMHTTLAIAVNSARCVSLLFGKDKVLISTGPGIAIIPAIAMRAKGGVVIHVETWSRFTTKSATGRLMYLLAQHFLIQNTSLTRHYPTAIYAGRL